MTEQNNQTNRETFHDERANPQMPVPSPLMPFNGGDSYANSVGSTPVAGDSPSRISQRQIEEILPSGILTLSGKTQWSVSTVKSILSNEKYKGDALLQKTYTADFLNKTVKKNEGALPQYYIENSHPAIISPETFDLVQGELRRRSAIRRQLNNNSPFAAKIICGECPLWFCRERRRGPCPVGFCSRGLSNARRSSRAPRAQNP